MSEMDRGDTVENRSEKAKIQTGRSHNSWAMSDPSTGPRRGPK